MPHPGIKSLATRHESELGLVWATPLSFPKYMPTIHAIHPSPGRAESLKKLTARHKPSPRTNKGAAHPAALLQKYGKR